MRDLWITTYCLGNGALKCDGCGQEKTWQMLNQLPDALRKSLQSTAKRIDDEECILRGRPWYQPPFDAAPQPPKGGAE